MQENHNIFSRIWPNVITLVLMGLMVVVYNAQATEGSRSSAASSNAHLPVYTASQSGGDSNVGWQVPACGSFNTAPYYTIPGLQTTFTTAGSSQLELSFAGIGRNSENLGSIYAAFFVDGQKINTAFGHEQLGGCRNDEASSSDWTWCDMSNVAAETVGAGQHTVEVKVKCDPTSTSEARVWNGWLIVKDHAQ